MICGITRESFGLEIKCSGEIAKIPHTDPAGNPCELQICKVCNHDHSLDPILLVNRPVSELARAS